MGDRGYGRNNFDGHRRHSGNEGRGYGGRGGFNKRKREDEYVPEDGGERKLLSALIKVADLPPPPNAPPPEEDIALLHRMLQRFLHKPELRTMLLDCVVDISVKTPVYATVVGLLNADDEKFGRDVVDDTRRALTQALAAGQRVRARMLVRFLAALVAANVVLADAFLGIGRQLVEHALTLARADDAGEDEGRRWQPYADYLVYIALVALPWCGGEVADAAPADLERLLTLAQHYMDLRPRSAQPALRPFYEDARGGQAGQSDSGGASFLPQVWNAIEELRESGDWVVSAVPRFYLAFEPQLAAGNPHRVLGIVIPEKPPGVPSSSTATPSEIAAAVLEAFPPRGLIRLLAPEHTLGERLLIDRLVHEEYILDTIHAFDGDRVECARRLALGIPVPDKHESALAETLFSQMLRLPKPHFKPLAYSTIMVDVCKLMTTFPRSMSACVRECFARIEGMDPDLRIRLSDWLAYHLSNFEFMWPWQKWEHVLTAPPSDAQRRFVIATLSKLIRLSYWRRVQAVLPQPFHALLPPEPLPQPLAPEGDPPASNGDASHDSGGDAEGRYAAEMLQLVRNKVMSEGILAWLNERVLERAGPQGVLRIATRALLVAGAKSLTHMMTALERYETLLQTLRQAAGPEGEAVLVETGAEVWKHAPQRAVQAIDRLMTLRLVGGEAIIRWALGCPGVRALGDELQASIAWEALHTAVDKTLARLQDLREDMRMAKTELARLNATATMAAESTARLAAEAERQTEPAIKEHLSNKLAQTQEANEVAQAAARTAIANMEQRERAVGHTNAELQELLLLALSLFRDLLMNPPPEAPLPSATPMAIDAAPAAEPPSAPSAEGPDAAAKGVKLETPVPDAQQPKEDDAGEGRQQNGSAEGDNPAGETTQDMDMTEGGNAEEAVPDGEKAAEDAAKEGDNGATTAEGDPENDVQGGIKSGDGSREGAEAGGGKNEESAAKTGERGADTGKAGPSGGGHAGGQEVADEHKETRVWYKFTLANMRAFARCYYVAIAPLALKLESEEFAEGTVPACLREAMLEALHI